jgi:hypothetical protein
VRYCIFRNEKKSSFSYHGPSMYHKMGSHSIIWPFSLYTNQLGKAEPSARFCGHSCRFGVLQCIKLVPSSKLYCRWIQIFIRSQRSRQSRRRRGRLTWGSRRLQSVRVQMPDRILKLTSYFRERNCWFWLRARSAAGPTALTSSFHVGQHKPSPTVRGIK